MHLLMLTEAVIPIRVGMFLENNVAGAGLDD